MPLVEVEKKKQVVTVTINNPPANALTPEVFQTLEIVFSELDEDDTKVVILTGAGDRFFVGGADIKQFEGQDADRADQLTRTGQNFTLSLERTSKPIIVAVNGFCLGGGMEITMACDFVIASETAKFGQPEIKLGVIPGWGGTQRIQRWMNPQLARELIFTGDIVPASQMGDFVYKIVPPDQLIPTAMALAERIAKRGLVALKYAKRALKEATQRTLEEGLFIEAQYMRKLLETEDAKEGVRAFLEKREPKVVDK
ncbi:MAG: enoyl-CoA hydratase-related protein [Candidatus Hermodarchaeota archaeon]|jgi:enoyl-CoA hydratase/carnithine racemase|nr:enoyl-CoA hydratase-related protein [Candidatus Hermodarchaeota archaeon]